MKKILIIVGGTGGHIYPGIALVEKLKEKNAELFISFVVDKKPLGVEILCEKGYPYYQIQSAPFPRKEFWQILRFVIKVAIGFVESLFLLGKLKPDVMVAFGAYISVPVVLAGRVFKIPVILHEQNYFPGLANRFLAPLADKIAVSYKSSLDYFPRRKTLLTGNPVRNRLFEVRREEGLKFLKLDKDKVTVLIFGGSQGAQSINLSILGMLPYLEGFRHNIQFVHICGNNNGFQDIINEYASSGFTARVFRFLKKMEYAYSIADVALARAGATTIAEIVALGIPAILVPYPGATSHHQFLNTKPLCKTGGAICYLDERLSGEGLAIKLIPLIKDGNLRRQMSLQLKVLKDRFTGASDKLAEVVLCLKKSKEYILSE